MAIIFLQPSMVWWHSFQTRNFFLEFSGTFDRKNSIERKSVVCFSITSFALCVQFPDIMFYALEYNSELTYENALDGIIFCEIFLYYLCVYVATLNCVECSTYISMISIGYMDVLFTSMGGETFLMSPWHFSYVGIGRGSVQKMVLYWNNGSFLLYTHYDKFELTNFAL